jgi:hypothetical protein
VRLEQFGPVVLDVADLVVDWPYTRSDPTKNLHRYYRLISASPSPAGRSLNPQAGGATPILTRGGLMDAKTLDLANKLHAQMAFRQGR